MSEAEVEVTEATCRHCLRPIKRVGDVWHDDRPYPESCYRALNYRHAPQTPADVEGLRNRIAEVVDETDAAPLHTDYPHEPGRLHGCPACEARCHCTGDPGHTECVFEGVHRG